MGRLLAFVYDTLMKPTERACLETWRGELLSTVSGDVLEVGAGTGANLAHYPAAVKSLVLAEPDPFMRRRLERAARGRQGVTVMGASLDALPFPDASFDVVVSTLVLCSVRDVRASLRETSRVLRPRGRLVFLEHVVADLPGRRRWQGRLEPLWRRIFGGCHLTRDTAAAIEAAGFAIERLEREDMRKAAPVVRPTIRGVARTSSGT